MSATDIHNIQELPCQHQTLERHTVMDVMNSIVIIGDAGGILVREWPDTAFRGHRHYLESYCGEGAEDLFSGQSRETAHDATRIVCTPMKSRGSRLSL